MCRSRMAVRAAAFCFWFLSCLLSVEARAQTVTSTGVQCDGSEISFDALNNATEGANDVRLNELARLFAYTSEAWKQCPAVGKGKTPPPDDLPGCLLLRSWVELRTTTGWSRDYERRAPLLSLDIQAMAAAKRVLAHAACKAAASQHASTQACADLVNAEAAAAGFSICVDDHLRRNVLVSMSPPGAPAPEKLKSLSTDCAAKTCTTQDQQYAALAARSAAVAPTYAFYKVPPPDVPGGPAASCPVADVHTYLERATDTVAQKVEAIPVSTPAPSLPNVPAEPTQIPPRPIKEIAALPPPLQCGGEPPPGPVEEKQPSVPEPHDVTTALSAEIANVLARRRECKNSNYYVSASGELIYHEDVKTDDGYPTVCVDSAAFAIDRPYQIEVSEYPSPERQKADLERDRDGVRPHSSIIAIWPGERIPLDTYLLRSDCSALVRITVRGYPRGVSLRALAQLGAAPLQPTAESSDLLAEQRKLDGQKAQMDANQAQIPVLRQLAAALLKDPTYTSAVSAMNKALDDPQAAKTPPIKEVDDAIAAIARFLDATAAKPESMSSVDAVSAIATGRKSVPPLLPPNAPLAQVQASAASVLQYASALTGAASDLQTGLDAYKKEAAAQVHDLARLCRISKQLVPVVDEDVLLAEGRKGIFVLDYDYEAGYQQSTPQKLMDGTRVYVRVRHVKPGGSVALSLDDKGIVQHSVSLIGMPSAAPATTPASNAQVSSDKPESFADLDPDRPVVQASSTQILTLPQLEGARRYELTICGLDGAVATCDSASKSRTIARNTMVVHSKGHLGVRAGLGLAGIGGPIRALAQDPATSQQYVREKDFTADFALPLLLAWYPGGRDTIEGPQGFSWGLTGGLDVLKVFTTPRLYLGAFADFYGFGLTAGALAESDDSVDLATNTYVASGATAPSTRRWYPGAFVALTTDFDIFNTVFHNYFSTAKYPTVGTTGGQ